MGVNKVNLGDETLIDLTGVTVNSQNLLNGATAIGADGEPVEGAVTYAPLTTSLAVTEEGVSALDGAVGKVLNDKITEIDGNLSELSNINYKYEDITLTIEAETTVKSITLSKKVVFATFIYNDGFYYLKPVISTENNAIRVCYNKYPNAVQLKVRVFYKD